MIINKEYGIYYKIGSYDPASLFIKYQLPDERYSFILYKSNIDDLMDIGYLKEHSIDYIIDEKTNLPIPIGIIEFLNNDKYTLNNTINIKINYSKQMYKCKQYLELIDKAIKIKYEEFKLYNKCKSKYQEDLILE